MPSISARSRACVLLLLLGALACERPQPAALTPIPPPPGVVVVVIDTLRWDRS